MDRLEPETKRRDIELDENSNLFILFSQQHNVCCNVFQFLDPCSVDFFHLKLVNSDMKNLVELLEPTHHLIHILQCIKNKHPIPSLHLQSTFALPKHVQEKIWLPSSYLHGRKVSLFLHQEMDKNVVATLFTTFVLLHASHPICISLIQIFPCNEALLFQLSIKDEWQTKAPLLFMPLSKMFRLMQSIEEQQFTLNEKWNSVDWSCAFINEYSIHPIFLSFETQFEISNAKSYSQMILNNKYLRRFLMSMDKLSYSFVNEYLFANPKWNTEYKFDVLLHALSYQPADSENICRWMDTKEELIAAMKHTVVNWRTETFVSAMQHPKWPQYKNDLDIQIGFFKMNSVFGAGLSLQAADFLSKEIPLRTTQNKSLVLKWLYHCPYIYVYLHEVMRRDKDVALASLKTNTSLDCLEEVLRHFSNDKQIIRKLAPLVLSEDFPSPTRALHSFAQNEPTFIIELLELNATLYCHLPLEQKKNKTFIDVVVQKNGLLVKKIPPSCITRDIIMEAVKSNGLALEFANQFVHDEEIQELAVRQNGFALKYIKRPSKKIIKAAINENPLRVAAASEFTERQDTIDKLLDEAEEDQFIEDISREEAIPKLLIEDPMLFSSLNIKDQRNEEWIQLTLQTSLQGYQSNVNL